MWKSVKNCLQEWLFNIYKWKWGRSRWIAYFENYLQKWLGDRYWEFPARFSTEFPTEFPTRIPTEFPARFPAEFPTEFPTRFPTEFPTRFPTEFPARFSCKNFLQDFPKLDPDWLAPHYPIPNAKFPPITAFLKLAFSPPPCPARFFRKNFLQDFPTRFSCQIFLSWILIGWLPIILFQMLNFHQSLPFLNWLFPSTLSRKIFPQDLPKLDPDWWVPHHPIPNAKFPPITALLNMPTYHKSAKVSPPPFP